MKQEKLHQWLLALMFAGYVAFFFFVSSLKFHSFSYQDIDLTLITQNFHAIVNFILFPFSYGNIAIFSGGHLPLLNFLLVPIYKIFPHTLTILFLQTFFLGSGVFGIYLIARNILGPAYALYFSFAYLIYPALNYVNLFEAHFIAFSAPLLLFMFYFFLRINFKAFLLFMFLALSVQEDISLAVMGFGVYALLSRRSKNISLKWAVVPFACSLAWFILVFFINKDVTAIAPIYKAVPDSGGVSLGYLGFFSWLGNTPQEMLGNLFLKPFSVIRHISAPHKLAYLFGLFMPLSFLPVLSFKGLLMILFGIAESLLSIAPPHSDIHNQYSAMVTPAIFISAMLGLHNLLRIKFLKEKAKNILVILISVSLLSAFAIGPFTAMHYDIRRMIRIKNSDYARVSNFFISLVPKDVPVIATFALSPHLAGRDFLAAFYMFVYSDLAKFIPQAKQVYTHALIDFDDQMTFYSGFYNLRTGLKERCFIFQEGWGLVETIDTLAFFKKGHKSDYKLTESMGFISPEEKTNLDLNSAIAMRESRYAAKIIEGFPVLTIEATFAKLKSSENNFLPVAEIINKDGRVLKKPLMAPFRIYPFSEWKVDEIVKIRSNIFLPEQFRDSELQVRISLVPLQ